MTYQTKMVLRLALPALMVFVTGMATAYSMDAISSLPLVLGGKAVFPEAGNTIALGTGLVAMAVYGSSMWRYWRWTRDEGDACFVCGCLLGREREGRFGPYRRCLGCGKNHALGRI